MLRRSFQLLGRLVIPGLGFDDPDQGRENPISLTGPENYSHKRPSSPATTDPDLFQKRVAELRMALATPETEKA